MCLIENLHQKADDLGGFDLDASPDTEELDLQVSEDVSSNVVAALTVLAGNEELFQSRQLKSETGIRGRLQMARLGLPCLFLSIARSPSCVLARTRVCFLPTVLDKCT